MRLAASALADSTNEYYSRHWRTFCEWCDRQGLEPLPATPMMVFSYIGYLAERGTIAATSLKPYLAAINSRHADAELPRPALGHLIARARAGLAMAQAADHTRDTRIPLPAEAVARVLDDAIAMVKRGRGELPPKVWAERLRARYALVLTFLFLGRQDTSVSLLSVDHGVDAAHIWLRITEKMKRGWAYRRVMRLPTSNPPAHGHASRLPDVARLGAAYTSARAALAQAQNGGKGGEVPDYFFQLPGEQPPRTAAMSAWVATALDAVNVRAPPGFAYLGHSLRSGGASAAEAIGVSPYKANWMGGWSQTGKTREVHYLDPSVQPSKEAYQLLGWLLQGGYTAGDPSWQVMRTATRATDEPGEGEGAHADAHTASQRRPQAGRD